MKMKQILVPIDLKVESQAILNVALSVAKAFGGRVWIIHVAAPEPDFVGYEAGPQYIRDMQADALRAEHVNVQSMAAAMTGQGIEAQALLVQGPTSETILAEAERLGIDLIVMGTHGRRGLAKAFMGSICDEVLRANKIKVLVVPTPITDP